MFDQVVSVQGIPSAEAVGVLWAVRLPLPKARYFPLIPTSLELGYRFPLCVRGPPHGGPSW